MTSIASLLLSISVLLLIDPVAAKYLIFGMLLVFCLIVLMILFFVGLASLENRKFSNDWQEVTLSQNFKTHGEFRKGNKLKG